MMTDAQAALVHNALNAAYAAWAGPRRSDYAKAQMALIKEATEAFEALVKEAQA